MKIRVLAIRTDFKHHGENHGYKQILKGIKPVITLGINERDSSTDVPTRFKKYPWLFEFTARQYKDQFDVLHILYGEDYFRWSTRLFQKKPIVVTYHQPSEILENEILRGSVRGRIGRLMHLLNKNRFKKLAAVIVTNLSQKRILEKVIEENKIHVIPLGINLDKLNTVYQKHQHVFNKRPIILTMGDWLRDWVFFFRIAKECPQWDFHIINRKLSAECQSLARKAPNITFFENINNQEVNEKLLSANFQFLPVTGMAGSNALIQGFALGLPLVLTKIDDDNQYNTDLGFVQTYIQDDVKDCISRLKSMIDLSCEDQKELKNNAHLYAQNYSWEKTIERTIEVYKKITK